MCEVIDKLYCDKKYGEVVTEIEKIRDTMELNNKYKIIYANSLIKSGNHDKALEEINKLILEGIDNYDINLLILKLVFIDKLDEAEKILLGKEKINSNGKFLLANIEQRRGNLDKACDMCVKLLLIMFYIYKIK